jgi:amino acid transporter
VLVGATSAKAGLYAPVSFLLAALVTAFTGLSYAELSTRMPVSAGEAAYVRAGFKSDRLALLVGLLVAASGIISSAAVSIGASSYIQHFISLPPSLIITVVILILGVVAIWGILESVVVASIFTLIEIVGLCLVVYFGLTMNPDIATNIVTLIPPFEKEVWLGIFSASLLAFFAFIGFEDMANVAEEVKDPRHTMPWAIILTLVISTFLYCLVVAVVVLSVPMNVLAQSSAPLALIFEQAGDTSENLFNSIAIIATLNGVLIQIIMASRILYGLAKQNNLPQAFAEVNTVTHTPLTATLVVVFLVLALALFFPIAKLAEATSVVVLIVFSLVNLALLQIKRKPLPKDIAIFEVSKWIPFIGFAISIILLLTGLL